MNLTRFSGNWTRPENQEKVWNKGSTGFEAIHVFLCLSVLHMVPTITRKVMSETQFDRLKSSREVSRLNLWQ